MLVRIQLRGPEIRMATAGYQAVLRAAREHASMLEAALKRPRDYFKLSSQDQWAIDERLGILDWSGPKTSEEQKLVCDHHGFSRREGDEDCDACTGCE